MAKIKDTLPWTTVLVDLQKSKTNDTLVSTSVSIVLNSPTKSTGLDQCIDSPIKSRTYDTLV